MRKYVRHPSDIPVDVKILNGHIECRRAVMKNIGKGGVSCLIDAPISEGARVEINVPSITEDILGCGVVAWCRPGRERYQLGVRFAGEKDAYRARMVEQLCQIEAYRRELESCEGRFLDGEQAAAEWIERYAADFYEDFSRDDNDLQF